MDMLSKFSPEVVERVDAEIRQFVLASLPYEKHKSGVVSDLTEMSSVELLVTYLSWLYRMIPTVPRKIHVSDSILTHPKLRQYKDAYQEICRAIESGSTLHPYLSRGVKHGYYRTKGKHKNLPGRRDMDLLLNEYEIHHLHLETEKEEDGFVKRSDDLLFAIFRNDCAFLIDIRPHDEEALWARRELFRTILRNWPQYNLLFEMKGILGPPEFKIDDIEDAKRHVQMRNVGLMSSVTIDGKTYIGAGCLSSAGTSVRPRQWARQLYWQIADFHTRWRYLPGEIRSILLAKGQLIGDSLASSAFYIDRSGKFGVITGQQNAFIVWGQVVF